MVVAELAAGPAEELEGGAGEGVGELEDVLDVGLGDADAGVLEGLLDGIGVGGGDDPAEELHFGREVGGVEVGGECRALSRELWWVSGGGKGLWRCRCLCLCLFLCWRKGTVFFDVGRWDRRMVVMEGSPLVLVPVLAHDFSERKLR